MVRNPLFTFGFSRVLTYFPGIVHGEISHPISLHQESSADDDAKCMTSRLRIPFNHSSPNVDAVFLLGLPGLPSDFCTELSTQVNAASSAPRKGMFIKEACKLGALAQTAPKRCPQPTEEQNLAYLSGFLCAHWSKRQTRRQKRHPSAHPRKTIYRLLIQLLGPQNPTPPPTAFTADTLRFARTVDIDAHSLSQS